MQKKRALIAILFIGVVFINVIQRFFPLFRYFDELVLALSTAYILYAFYKRELTKNIFIILAITASIIGVGLLGNALSGYQESYVGIFKDIIAFAKMPVTFCALILVNEKTSESFHEIAVKISKFSLSIISFFGILSFFVNTGMTYGIRRGIPTYKFLFTHPTYLVLAVVFMLVVLVADKEENRFYKLEAIFILLITQRDKAFAFIALYFVMTFILKRNIKFNIKHILFAGIAALCISLPKILEYASWSWSPRYALYSTSFLLLLKFFPFGSGFATIGSSTSGEYYSKVYEMYGMLEKPGMNPIDYSAVGDAQWSYYIGQFGLIGVILFIILLFYMYSLMSKQFKNNYRKYIASLLIVGYLLVSSLVENVFTNESGVTCFIILFMFLNTKITNGNYGKGEKTMNIFNYLKTNGFKRMVEVIYQYKIDAVIRKVLMIFLKNKPLKDIILIESHNDFDCNGGALYDYLIQNNYHHKYKIVWFLKHKLNKGLPENVDYVYIYKPSLKKNYYLCTAKYITADNVLPTKVRKEQKTYYFSHGAVNIKSTKGRVHLPENLNYFFVSSDNYAPISAEQLGWEYPNDKMVCLGYPMHDILFAENKTNEINKVSDSKFKKTILWMPTFRKGGGFNRNDSDMEFSMGIPLIDNVEMYENLNRYLKENDCLLIIKIHPMQDMSVMKIYETSNIKVLTGTSVKELDIDNYRLMRDVDALISDYSSVAFEFLLLNRPIAYVLCDEKEYNLGFVVDNPRDLMAGQEINTYEELTNFISNVYNNVDTYSQRRQELLDWVYKYHDGDSCKRIVEFMGLTNEK